jgi:hypothetical protein
LSFFALIEINKLPLINQAQNSDSPRLHHFCAGQKAEQARRAATARANGLAARIA